MGEATLFESRRPMIAVPYIQKEPFKINNVMICWGTAAAPLHALLAMQSQLSEGAIGLKSSSSPTSGASNTTSKELISSDISPATDSKLMSNGFRAAISMSPTHSYRTPPIALPTSWLWAVLAIRECANSCSVASPVQYFSR